MRRPAPSVEDVYAGPIRGELLGAEHLADRARELAQGQRFVVDQRRRSMRRRPARLLIRLGQSRDLLEDAYARLAGAVGRGTDVGPAGDWLLDNFYVIREHISQVHESLPENYFRELPLLTHETLSEYPRVYELAITLISHTEGRIDLASAERFVSAYQESHPLALGELWAIPAMLRLGLIESVRRMALRTVQRLDEVEEADHWVERIRRDASEFGDGVGAAVEALVSARPNVTPTFVSRLVQQLRAAGGASGPLVGLERWFAEEGLGPTEASSRAAERLALTTLVMANSITSLRTIARYDWREFVEGQSVMERILAEDPTSDYLQMTFASRDQYRHAVERITKGSAADENTIARTAVRMAQEAVPGTRQAHVGYWLIDDGVAALETAVVYQPPVMQRAHGWVLRHATFVYAGGITAATIVALAPVYVAGRPATLSALLALMAVATLPALDIAVTFVSQLITNLLPPHAIPKLDFGRTGVPASSRTAIVVPTLLPTVSAATQAIEDLEVQFLANRGAHLHFALLTDLVDAATETQPHDAAIIDTAQRGVRALNARYAEGGDAPFYLFHRPRKWNPTEGTWMGWERKRGKLGEFNRFLRGGAASAFAVVEGDVARIRDVRYVITLDADTVLPPDTAPALIGAIAHPLNRAVYCERHGRVVAGYGILQPRVGVSLASAHRTVFASIHSGHPGVDPYTVAVSDVYQDLFGEGSFAGKGIYDVDAFERATHGRFPENTLLSHDLIEGNYARAGLVTDLTVFDDYPARYLSYARRKHRWIRGDWQLLRWLTPSVPGPEGAEPNRLSALARWKLLDNLRRSTIELAQLVFLVVGWVVLPAGVVRWTLLGLLAIAAPWILSTLIAILTPPAGKSMRAYYLAVGQDALTSLQQVLLAVVYLAHQAWLSVDAIVRTLWRLFVSHRHLLEWRSAAATESASVSSAPLWRAMLPSVLVALAAGAAAWGWSPNGAAALALAAPFVLAWSVAPAVAWRTSRPVHREVKPLTDVERATALRYARSHWSYFARFANASTAWLAPDNVQEDPEQVVAMRTSPTNIGLQLLSTISAHDLGFITRDEMVVRLESAFAALRQLPRYHGHLYNWYALPSLTVLEPAYVSTVDSGNLAGHLIALRQACRAMAAALPAGEVATAARLEGLAAEADTLVASMDFRFLYDHTTKLFAIGFNVSTHQRDLSSYDLLASEARLASFVAIAKDEVPPEHWFHLGRTLNWVQRQAALVSWSGSMFEYLMPILVMRAFPATLLGQTYATALDRQIRHGAEHDVPWGVSESAYNVRDRHQTYQYRAFGVPELGFQRGLGRDLVIAPYASGLAMMIDPVRALQNLQRLEALGAHGPYGFYDALDYSRPPADGSFTMVRCNMAHHVGMTLVALTNTLLAQKWQERFHADPLVRAAALLLDERVPRRLDFQSPLVVSDEAADEVIAPARPVVREYDTVATARPHVALLGHAPLNVMVTHAGSGYSQYGDLAVTRWRPDGTRDDTGQFCYVRDCSAQHLWSVGHQPTGVLADSYHAHLATDRVSIRRRDGEVETCVEIVVVPEDAAEVRRVTVTNHSDVEREVEVTSYGEIVLASRAADRAHPAFSNLFVQTEWHEWCGAITATRRPRAADESVSWLVHVVDAGPHRVGPLSCETDRGRFLGRGRSVRDPIAVSSDGALSGTTGAVLDPIFAIQARVRLAPGHAAAVAFTTLVAPTRERAFELADRYHGEHAAQRALDLAWTSTQVELRELGVTPADAAACQELASYILFPDSVVRPIGSRHPRRDGWQQTLWAHGISGDNPVVLAVIDSTDGLPTLQHLLTAHRYWRLRGVIVDLVVVVKEPQGYVQELHLRITALVLATGGSAVLDAPGGIHVRNRGTLGDEDYDTIAVVARLDIACDGRVLGRIVADLGRTLDSPPELRTDRAHIVRSALTDAATPREPLQFDNGLGGLTTNGRYRIHLADGVLPPAPWSNVIANARGGFIVTERGGGFTYAANSYFFRLTPWSNDPVTDAVGEALYIRDEATGEFWGATPAPVRRDAAYVVEHGAGVTEFRHEHIGIASRLTLGMADEDPVKIARLELTNLSDRPREISVTSYVEWTLGVLREQTQHRVRTGFVADLDAIFAGNPFDPQFAGWVAFSAMSDTVTQHTGDRREFIGRNGSLGAPAGLNGVPLRGRTGLGVDPCAALRCTFTLAPGASHTTVVLLGAAATEEESRQLVAAYRTVADADAALARGSARWARRLSVITVTTPDAALDAMVNQWALYQTLACRILARSAVYQSSGAYGFRDQLQDVMAILYAEPTMAREHIVKAAARQFVEGDVQHWWHPETGRGVRTRFSDDLVWLPFVVEHYVRVTGDESILHESIPFLTMRALEPHEHELYDQPQVSDERATLFEHCRRALAKATTHGVHGLPLIGTGDWNDGMNRVGMDGRGESVWLGWFLIDTLRAFAPIAERQGDPLLAVAWRAQAEVYALAVETHGWDGGWYRRAYFDDGTPLGSASQDECRIDSLAQSWSVISGAGDPARQIVAMQALETHLVDRDARLIRLLTPAFDKSPVDPGYIKGYVPGVRENGAQYTHAALWAVLAAARRGDGARAVEWFDLINAFTLSDTPAKMQQYRVEPYVVAADVYTTAGSVGRGGWTWYTGSSSWMYRVALEELIGLRQRGASLTITPSVPVTWPSLQITYRYHTATYVIDVEFPGRLRDAGARVWVDGVAQVGELIPLADDGREHAVRIRPL